jgi:hypothetical protein
MASQLAFELTRESCTIEAEHNVLFQFDILGLVEDFGAQGMMFERCPDLLPST